jgi:hypothetical protein
MGWAGHHVHGGDKKCIQYFGWENLNGIDHSEVIGIDRRILLKWILGK